jgi:hypothetical protein
MKKKERAYVLAKQYISGADIVDIEEFSGGMYIVTTTLKNNIIVSIGKKTERVYSFIDGEIKEITNSRGA